VAIGRETPLLPHEAERGERRQPCKPLRRIRGEREFAEIGTDDYIPTTGPLFNQGDQTGTCWLFRWVHGSAGGG
jgi:hypothetical protein